MKYLISNIFVILCLVGSNYLYAQHVSETDAIRIAQYFCGNDEENSCSEKRAEYRVLAIGGQSPTMYKISYPQGWVIVSADQRVCPILAYSDVPEMFEDTSHVVDNVLIAWYNDVIAYVRDSVSNEEIHPEWRSLSLSSQANRDVVVPPLMVRDGNAIAWRQAGNQNGYSADCNKTYNKYFPTGDNGDLFCHKYLVGCVNLSAAEVMWYWQWPKSAMVRDENGNYIYREYDWDNIPYILSNSTSQYSADMTATLLHDVAMADSSEFLPAGTSASESALLFALNNVFCSDGTAVSRNDYNNIQWRNMIKAELNNGRPVLYSGCFTHYSFLNPPLYMNDCHQFVIDGYRSDNFFHIIYSQSNGADGYYTLNLENDNNGTNVYYNGMHRAIIGIQPQIDCTSTGINTNESWSDWFNKVYVEGITISNKVIPAGSKGVITSKQYVILESGFTIKHGATVQISVNEDLSCVEPNRNETNRRTINAKHEAFNDHVSLLQLSPNPVKDILNIKFNDELTPQVSIYTISGQCVLQASQADVDVSSLPKGMYLLRAVSAKGQELQGKFIKQ